MIYILTFQVQDNPYPVILGAFQTNEAAQRYAGDVWALRTISDVVQRGSYRGFYVIDTVRFQDGRADIVEARRV